MFTCGFIWAGLIPEELADDLSPLCPTIISIRAARCFVRLRDINSQPSASPSCRLSHSADGRLPSPGHRGARRPSHTLHPVCLWCDGQYTDSAQIEQRALTSECVLDMAAILSKMLLRRDFFQRFAAKPFKQPPINESGFHGTAMHFSISVQSEEV